MTITDQKRRDQLLQEGFCLVENVLAASEVAELREATDGLLAAMSAEDVRRERTTGSMISVVKDHRLAKLIAHPRFGSLPEEMRATFVTRCDPLPTDWPADARRLYESVAIRYSGNATPMPFSRGWVSKEKFFAKTKSEQSNNHEP